MKSSLINKINYEINGGLNKEAEVLYILAQCRKFLENPNNKNDDEKKFPTLSLVGDWVLHTQLNGIEARKKLKEYADFLSEEKSDTLFNFMKSGFTLFQDLKAELTTFSREYGLSDKLVSDQKLWRKFISLLIKILIDLPLIDRHEGVAFRFGTGFVISKKESAEFTISYKDGRNKNFSVDLDVYA